MDKITDAELTTLKVLVQNARQQTTLAQQVQMARQDYADKIKAAYSLSDKDGVNLETGVITKAPVEG